MSPVLNRSTVTIALLGLMACGGADNAGEAGAGLDGPDRQVAWDREPLYEVGGADADGWAAFGSIDDVGFDAAGNLYVLDSQATQIHVVSPDGTLLRSMGTPGKGPGELGQTRGMTVFPDGAVSVFDMAKFAMVVYGPDGEWIRDVRIDPSATGLLTPPFLPLQARTVLAQVGGRITMGPNPSAEPPEPGRAIVTVPLEEEAGDPAVIMRMWEAPEPGASGEEASMKGEGGGSVTFRMSRLRGFTPEVRLSALRDGRIAAVDTTTYSVDLYSPDGTFVRTLSRPIAPTQVTPALEDAERDRRMTALESSGGGVRVMVLGGSGGGSMRAPDMTEMMRGRIEDMIFYPEIQVIERIAADWNDRIWVQRASGQPGKPGPTDIITPEGDYLGTLPADGLRIPRAFGPDGLAVWVERDEFDAERLVVARISPAG